MNLKLYIQRCNIIIIRRIARLVDNNYVRAISIIIVDVYNYHLHLKQKLEYETLRNDFSVYRCVSRT